MGISLNVETRQDIDLLVNMMRDRFDSYLLPDQVTVGRDLADLGPVHLLASNATDTTSLYRIPFHGNLQNCILTHSFGAEMGCPCHGQGVSGNRISPSLCAAGIESGKGLFRCVLFPFR